MRFTTLIEKNYFFLVIIFSVFGYIFPQVFKWLVNYIPLFLGIIMVGMGTTLRIRDFVIIVKFPKAVIVGVIAQFCIMPMLAFLLVTVLKLPNEIAIGTIIVGSSPGGTASNVITYLAGGNVALSVVMTSCSTLLSPLVTPTLIYIFAGKWISVSAVSMVGSILKIIILPIGLGILLQYVCKQSFIKIERILPSVSIIAIATIIAGITAANAENLPTVGFIAVAVVVMHNVLGLIFGYVVATALRFDTTIRRTIAIEVGMQNSGLAVSLAVMHFSPLAALPGGIFSIWHNISGSFVAWVWSKKNRMFPIV